MSIVIVLIQNSTEIPKLCNSFNLFSINTKTDFRCCCLTLLLDKLVAPDCEFLTPARFVVRPRICILNKESASVALRQLTLLFDHYAILHVALTKVHAQSHAF
jgi:hypothetical protein